MFKQAKMYMFMLTFTLIFKLYTFKKKKTVNKYLFT
jgi:hypothetical protein